MEDPPLAASRRFQQKKRAELLALRSEAETLEKKVAELSRRRHERTSTQRSHAQELNVGSGWVKRYVEERRQLREAETYNRKLKKLVAQQHQETKVLRRLLRSVTSWQSVHAVRRPISPRNANLADFQDAVVEELAGSMDQMFLDSSSMLGGMNASKGSSMPASPIVQWDAVTGLPYVELNASICLETNMIDALGAIWAIKVDAPYTHHSKHTTKDGLRKDATLKLGNAMNVDVLSLAQMREDKHRILCTWASRVFHDSADKKLHVETCLRANFSSEARAACRPMEGVCRHCRLESH